MKRVLRVVLIVLALVLVVCGGFFIWALGGPDYPEPSGPHAVGSLEVSFRDTKRPETLGADPGDPREVGVRIWYPAAKGATGPRLPIIDGRLAKAFSEIYGAPTGDEDGPPSSSIIDAAPLAGDRLPVVLFSHGGFAHRGQNISTMQDLASQGVIVVAIGHSHESVLALLPGGRSIEMDPRLRKGMEAFSSGDPAAAKQYRAALDELMGAEGRDAGVATARELGAAMTKMLAPVGRTPAELVAIRHGDVAFVIEQLALLDADADHQLKGRYDLERLGIFGHSLGGHAAISACLDKAIPVRACAALDIVYYLFDERPVPTLERPVLFAYAESSSMPGGQPFGLTGSNRFLRDGATAETLGLTVKGTAHMNFSDMNFMPRGLRLMGMLGPLEGGRASKITNDLTVSFFRRHLMNERESWLDAPSKRYPEVY